MKNSSAVKFLLVSAAILNLLILPGPIAVGFHAATVQSTRSNPAPTGPPVNPGWIPAGPSMNTLTIPIFTDGTAQLTCLQAPAPCVDLTDTRLSPGLIPILTSNPNFYVTSPVLEHGYEEIEFNLANNFWGCNFTFGGSPCGIEVRQGIAHLIDRTIFVNSDPSILGNGRAIDNPVPPNGSPSLPNLPTPNSCNWDASFPEVFPTCEVGQYPGTWTGGTAYHLGVAAGVNYPWQPALGSLDFCAAAQHFINAGLAAGKAANCVLVGIAPIVAANTVNFFIRVSPQELLDMGASVAQEICALFGQGFVSPCAPFLTVTHGEINSFPGYLTSKTTVSLSWGIYTADFRQGFPFDTVKGVYPFDGSLYLTYNSIMVSGIPGIQPPMGPCSGQALPSFTAENYMYLCAPSYDTSTNQMEFATCVQSSIPPDVNAQVGMAAANLVNCVGSMILACTAAAGCPTTVCTGCSALSAAYQSEDIFGRGAYTIPIDTTIDQFAYLSNIQRVMNDQGTGIPNFYTWLNAWIDPSAIIAGQTALDLRQGLSSSARSLSPYVASTRHDFDVISNIYDTLIKANPMENDQYICWMMPSCPSLFSNTQLTYTPPVGTTMTMRVTLRSDMFWQDGQQVTAADVAFSYLSLLANGAYQASPILGTLAGVTVINLRQVDINLRAIGPFTLESLGTVTIIPGSYWSSAGVTSWRGSVTSCRSGAGCFPAQYNLGSPSGSAPPPINCALACGLPASMMNADPSKTTLSFDPLASGNLIGSGPWECLSGAGVLGTGCSSSGSQNPPPSGSYTLQRFGFGTTPGAGLNDHYFRSSGNLALYIWSQDNGDFTHDFVSYSIVASRYGGASRIRFIGGGPGGDIGHWVSGDPIVYDTNGNWVYELGEPVISGVPAAGAVLSYDPLIRYWDNFPADNKWEPGETVIYDSSTVGDGAGGPTYDAADQVILGPAPPLGTPLKSQSENTGYKTGPGTHWQEGIGDPAALPIDGNIIGIVQLSIVSRFVGVSWVAPTVGSPAGWNSLNGIIAAGTGTQPGSTTVAGQIVLFEGGGPLTPLYTLNPASIVGCVQPNNDLPTVPAYPNDGGYDC